MSLKQFGNLLLFAVVVFSSIYVFWRWTIPTVSLIALWLVIFRGNKVVEIGGKTVKLGWLVVVYIASFYLFLVFLRIVFNIPLGDLYTRLGMDSPLLSLLLTEPTALGKDFGIQLAGLAAAALMALIYTRAKYRAFYQWCALLLCLTFMAGRATYLSSSPKARGLWDKTYDSSRQASGGRLISMSHAFSVWSHVKTAEDKIRLDDEETPTRYVQQPDFLFDDQMKVVTELQLGEKVEKFLNQQREEKGIILVYCGLRRGKDFFEGWVPNSSLENKPPSHSAQVTPPLLTHGPRQMPVTTPVPVAPDLPLRSRVKEDVINLTSKNWVNSEVWTDEGDTVEIRAANGELLPEADIKRIAIRSGNATPGTIGLNYPNDNGMAYGLSTARKSNPFREPIRLKLLGDDELAIRLVLHLRGSS